MEKITENQDSERVAHDAYAGVKLQLQPAPILRRMLAYTIDLGFAGCLVYAFGFLVIVIIAVIGGAGAVSGLSLATFRDWAVQSLAKNTWLILLLFGIFIFVFLGILIINHGYFVVQEFKKGTTPGKKFMGLKVVSLNGSRLTMKQVMGREVFRYVDCMLFFPGLFSTLFTAKGQRLGDLFAGTMVVYSKSLENEIHYLYLKREDYLLIESQVVIGEFTQDQEEEFLQFSYQYHVGNRAEIAADMIAGWERFADALVQTTEDFPLHPKDKFLFAAEYFRQKNMKRIQA
ncbi:MAG: RDD family protein [Proteobacteria bacterium]|nr:MAG: RDD family protein [Pseudomonadota bacterium]